jgi:hypothetical protein
MTQSNDTPAWTWPAGRAIVLYEWSWFDQAKGSVISGWSQQSAVDAHGYVHLEAEDVRPPETLQVDQEGYPSIKAHTFTAMTGIPDELSDDAGAPLSWVRALLGAD